MRRFGFIVLLLISTCCALAQQVETARYEVPRWSKNQGCHFESFQQKGGMMVYETDKTDEEKNRLWNFVTLDTSLYEQRSDLIPLPDDYVFFDAGSSSQWAAFVFVEEKPSRSDSVSFYVVTYHRADQEFSTFLGKLPECSVLHAMGLLDGTLMLAANGKTGGGFLAQYDLNRTTHRFITPNIGNDFILFQFKVLPEDGVFVLAAREFVEKHYKATAFMVYSKDGALLRSHRFDNPENAGLGRMCFAFDEARQLTVYATLEREGNKKISVEDMADDFSKEAVGVTWIKFAHDGMRTKTWLFKDFPEIEQALTASDRLRFRGEMLKIQQGKKKEQGEIAFQFYEPRLVKYGDGYVFAVEAFQPIFHTETRMEYSYHYGSFPMSYTVFDGYDFFSEILLSVDSDGRLLWFNAVRFENELCDALYAHSFESVSHDELVVVSPGRHALRYEVFDTDGAVLLSQEMTPLDFLYSDDSFDDEYSAGVDRWYGDRFLIHGCQIVQNPALRNTRRVVFYVQKVQYE